MSTDVEKDFQNLVLARLQTLPGNAMISIGGGEEINKQKLLQHVEDGDELGKKFIAIEKEFLRALKEGEIYA